jgi:hypothetical protein
MIRALGKTTTLNAGQTLSKHDFLLPLSDVLLDLAEENPDGPSALSCSQLACSLAHDFVNLATVAGQLLWYVGVAPLRTGTPDSLMISLLAESYLVSLRTAYDIIAATVLRFCVAPKLRGQLPKNESFNDLVEWVQKNPTRAPTEIQFVTEDVGSFKELRGIRDKLVHNSYDLIVFTNDLAPQFGLMSTGEAVLHFLRKPKTRFPNAPTLEPLLPFLRRATQSVLLRQIEWLSAYANNAIISLLADTFSMAFMCRLSSTSCHMKRPSKVRHETEKRAGGKWQLATC